jgi:hypothetical protein
MQHGINTAGSAMKSYLKKLKPIYFGLLAACGFEQHVHYGESEHALRCQGKLGQTPADQEYWVSTEGLFLLLLHWSHKRQTGPACACAATTCKLIMSKVLDFSGGVPTHDVHATFLAKCNMDVVDQQIHYSIFNFPVWGLSNRLGFAIHGIPSRR